MATALLMSLTACDTGTTGDTDNDADVVETTPSGQSRMGIDTTGTASYGQAGEMDRASTPDHDTVQGMDIGVHPGDIYREADTLQQQPNQ
jgi:hypothetical protein